MEKDWLRRSEENYFHSLQNWEAGRGTQQEERTTFIPVANIQWQYR